MLIQTGSLLRSPKKERQQCKTLVEQAKRKEETEPGNFIYRVRGLPGAMRIVKIQKN